MPYTHKMKKQILYTHCHKLLWSSIVIFALAFSLKAQTITIEGLDLDTCDPKNVLKGMGEGRDGAVSYNKATNTLILNGANLTQGIAFKGQQAGMFTIALVGDNTITTTQFGIYTERAITVTGKGSLQVKCASNNSGAFALKGEASILRFLDTRISIKGSSPEEGESTSFAIASLERGTGLLVFDHTNFTSDKGLIGAMRRISIKRSQIASPSGAYVGIKHPENDHYFSTIVNREKKANYGFISIIPNKKYALRIDDLDITEDNASNIFPNNTVPDSFAHYNPKTNTLTIRNLDFDMYNVPAIENFHDETDPPFTIVLQGFNRMWSVRNGVYSAGPMVIKGSGKLHAITADMVAGAAGIFIEDKQPLTIDNTTVIAEGYFGICAPYENDAKCTINNSEVKIICSMPDKPTAGFIGFNELNLNDVKLVSPSDAYFSTDNAGIVRKVKYTDDDGNPKEGEVYVKDPIVISKSGNAAQLVAQPIPRYITSQNQLMVLASGTCMRIDVYTLSGQLVNNFVGNDTFKCSLPQGVYVLVINGSCSKVYIP